MPWDQITYTQVLILKIRDPDVSDVNMKAQTDGKLQEPPVGAVAGTREPGTLTLQALSLPHPALSPGFYTHARVE